MNKDVITCSPNTVHLKLQLPGQARFTCTSSSMFPPWIWQSNYWCWKSSWVHLTNSAHRFFHLVSTIPPLWCKLSQVALAKLPARIMTPFQFRCCPSCTGHLCPRKGPDGPKLWIPPLTHGGGTATVAALHRQRPFFFLNCIIFL